VRERCTEQRIFEELRLEGYAGSVDQVRRYYGTLSAAIAPRRRLSRRASLPVRRISTSAPARRVESWTTVDITIGYRVDGGSGWLANTQANLGKINALDQRPPFVN
jgi:outer membrane receptor protein involved in Fe transport